MMNQKMLENAHRKIIELGEKNAREDIVKLSRNLEVGLLGSDSSSIRAGCIVRAWSVSMR